MKKRIALWTVVGLVVVALVATVTRADLRGRRGWCGLGWHHGGGLGYVARELKLNNTQISEVRSIWTAERPTVAALLKELLDGAHQMADATAGGKLDEDQVHAIAAAEADTFAKLLVEREHIKSRIYTTVLNEEQRQSADRLQQHLLGRLDHAVSRLQLQNQ
jgi:hypothetical protein